MRRRTFLSTGAALAAASTAGCTGVSGVEPPIKDTYLTFAGGDLAAASQRAGPPEDVMAAKLGQAVETLTTPNLGEAVYLEAVDEGMEAIYMSNLVVLPTEGVEEADSFFDVFVDLTVELTGALSEHVDRRRVGTERSAAAAMAARNFVQVATEAMRVIGAETGACNPADPEEECELLSQTDEPGEVRTAQVADLVRQVRSPFFLGFDAVETTGSPHEEVITVEALAAGECVPVVKETKGVKVIVRPMRVPIWVEPWFARRRIVGFRTVWVWEFVPAEFVKTIVYCNPDGTGVTTTVDKRVIVERELMHFWRFFRKDP